MRVARPSTWEQHGATSKLETWVQGLDPTAHQGGRHAGDRRDAGLPRSHVHQRLHARARCPSPRRQSPVARQFIDAYLQDDKATLDALNVGADDKLQSARFRAEFARVDEAIHLGSYIGGGFSLHAYAAHVVRPDGTEDLLSWRIVTAGGQVFIVDPPTQGQKP